MSTKGRKLVYSTRTEAQLDSKKASQSRTTSLPPQQQTIHIMIDRKRRRGKTVTICSGFQLTNSDLKALEKMLKQVCGAGGTSKGDEIEIQGNHRETLLTKLAALNYKVKRAGG